MLTDKQKERFMSYVMPIPESGCWVWMGGVGRGGYGKFYHNSKTVLAHRISYLDAFGEIPHGLQLDHLCRVRCCVNPNHLEPVTARTNVMRGEGPAAINSQKTHCVNGHSLEDAYAWIGSSHPYGLRHCKACNRTNARQWYQRKKGLPIT